MRRGMMPFDILAANAETIVIVIVHALGIHEHACVRIHHDTSGNYASQDGLLE